MRGAGLPFALKASFRLAIGLPCKVFPRNSEGFRDPSQPSFQNATRAALQT
jgi:hypothetical protein